MGDHEQTTYGRASPGHDVLRFGLPALGRDRDATGRTVGRHQAGPDVAANSRRRDVEGSIFDQGKGVHGTAQLGVATRDRNHRKWFRRFEPVQDACVVFRSIEREIPRGERLGGDWTIEDEDGTRKITATEVVHGSNDPDRPDSLDAETVGARLECQRLARRDDECTGRLPVHARERLAFDHPSGITECTGHQPGGRSIGRATGSAVRCQRAQLGERTEGELGPAFGHPVTVSPWCQWEEGRSAMAVRRAS